MTNYRCNDCGSEFEEDDLKPVREPRGEYFGFPAYETYYYCPVCGSDDYEEITVETEDSENED